VNKRHFEEEARSLGYLKVAGVDEAGRGPLAGPLVVAACILPEKLSSIEIDDSKKLSPRKRDELYDQIVSYALSFSIITLSAEIIDQMNILQATLFGMQKAVEQLSLPPDFVLVDGNRSPKFAMPSKAIIQGDGLSDSIGAASILAKVTRDRIMTDYDQKWPEYGFAIHKGYPTKKHIEALESLGPCPIHRMSYSPVQKAFLRKVGSVKPAFMQLELPL
jgi:ribonuclease HII